MTQKNQVVIIGGGIAELVAAYQLKKSGIKCVVLEASDIAGGRMISENHGNCIIGCGAQFLSTGYPIITGLINELGVGKDFSETKSKVGIVKKGKVHIFHYNSHFSLLFSGMLTLGTGCAWGVNGRSLYKQSRHCP